MARGVIVTLYIPKALLDKLDKYAENRLMTRGRAVQSILIEYFGNSNKGNAESEGDK